MISCEATANEGMQLFDCKAFFGWAGSDRLTGNVMSGLAGSGESICEATDATY